MSMALDRDLERIASGYQGEVFGEAAYRTAGRVARSGAQRRKWEVLAQLECQMKKRLANVLIQEKRALPNTASSRLAGRAAGLVVGVAPWTIMLRLFRNAVAGSAERYGAWEKEASPGFAEVLREFAKHEQVQLIFIDLELEGNSDTSLDGVRSMLRDGIPSR
jgi:hypothetical protein